MRRSVPRRALAAVCLLAAVTIANGQEALYGKQPGRNAIFVRFVNALDTAVSIQSDLLAPVKLGVADKDRIGAYMAVDRSDVASIAFSAQTSRMKVQFKVGLETGSTVSILLRPDGDKMRAIPLSAPLEINQSRTLLSFVNAAPPCGASSLLLEPRHAVIFADVPVDKERSRRINPVTAKVAASCGNLGTVDATLERSEPGVAYSLWLLSVHDRPALILGTDILPTWHP